MKVHACGQYQKNTVVGILEAEHGLAPLFRILICVSALFLIIKVVAKAMLEVGIYPL